MTPLSYCAEQVRRYDHDRFLTVIFAPAWAREDLFALYAFNLEIAKAREVVSEPLIGLMRLQWWRDTLDRLYQGDLPAHQIARPLGEAIGRNRLPRADFDRLIDARETDFDESPIPDLSALDVYAAATAGAPLELALRILAGGRDIETEVGRHIGTAWALIGLLRTVPFHASRRRLYLPRDRLAEEGVRPGQLFEGAVEPGLIAVVRDVADLAADQLRRGRALRGVVPKACRSALLLAGLADLYLADFRRLGWNPFAPEIARGRPLAIARLAGLFLRNRY